MDLGAWREVGGDGRLIMPTHWAPYTRDVL